jgi:hypothetical protein
VSTLPVTTQQTWQQQRQQQPAAASASVTTTMQHQGLSGSPGPQTMLSGASCTCKHLCQEAQQQQQPQRPAWITQA